MRWNRKRPQTRQGYWPSGYFAAGCAMHLSHIYLDINVWYDSLDYASRVKRMFSPRTPVPTDPVGAGEPGR